MAYSKDYRQLILNKLEEGYSIRQLAEEYQISTNTIQRWKTFPERKKRQFTPTKIDDELLRADVAAHPDDYQHERARRFNCTQRAIGIALKRISITQKKELNASKSR
ncbi:MULTISPECIES: IS630 transposase-related protein [unclassified Psychrobacter]|uniref:IS630 transposase-related protein n=1 Tax=unclassified Psychrobacter TaxID=196806 RepID=UPI0025EE9C0D|nr:MULTISPECIES: IS630 transposase-related protein [unclassified Psychrobacter]